MLVHSSINDCIDNNLYKYTVSMLITKQMIDLTSFSPLQT